MKVMAVIQADLDATTLGTRSRLAEPLCGVPILRRTVMRVARASHVDSVHVVCPVGQRDRCAALLEGSPALVGKSDRGPAPWASLVRASRKWSLDGWRGGIGDTTHFDEYTDPGFLRDVIDAVPATTVLSLPPGAAVVDPELIDRMIEHHWRMGDDTKMTFTTAPPGLAGLLLDAELVRELADKAIPVGFVFSYKPDTPQKDLVFQPACCEVPAAVRYASGRLVGDTDRSVERLHALLGATEDPDAETIGRWLIEREDSTTETLPREVEIELTTEDPYPDAILRPRGSRIGTRGPIDPGIVARISSELSCGDDALLVLGGFGDPLCHPRFAEVLGAIRSIERDGRAVFGVAVRTTGVGLTDEHIDALLSHRVDVLEVCLDAWSPELYGRLQSPSDPTAARLVDVQARLDRLGDRRQEAGSATPILVPQMTKARDNVSELDDFHDGWLRSAGAVLVTGHGHHAGQMEDRSVMRMAPSPRSACRRLRSRCMVLADGRLVVCDQDVEGRHSVGSLTDRSLESLWTDAEFDRVRAAHHLGQFDPTPLCAACDEWHRP